MLCEFLRYSVALGRRLRRKVVAVCVGVCLVGAAGSMICPCVHPALMCDVLNCMSYYEILFVSKLTEYSVLSKGFETVLYIKPVANSLIV